MKMETSGFGDTFILSDGAQQVEKRRLPNVPRVPSMTVTRVYAPIRPVYDDFATAHSSITSRSAIKISKNNSAKSPTKQAGILDRGRPLSRRIHKSLRRQKKPAEGKKLSLPTLGKPMNRECTSGFGMEISKTKLISSDPRVPVPSSGQSPMPVLPKRASDSLFMDSMKKIMEGKSYPATKSTQSRLFPTLRQPKDKIDLPGPARQSEYLHNDGQEDDGEVEISLGSSNRASSTGFPCHIHDHFVYDAGQHLVSMEGAMGGHNSAVDDDQKYDGSACNHVSGVGIIPIHDMPVPHDYQRASQPSHGNLSLAVDCERTLTRDESTVDNIVEHYAHNNGLWDISLDSNDEDSGEDSGHFHRSGIQESHQRGKCAQIISGNEDKMELNSQRGGKLNAIGIGSQRIFKLMGSCGQAPSAQLPTVPALSGHQTVKSISDGLGQSSSYGDTRKLLEITQLSLLASNTGYLRGDTGDRLTASNNPFRRNQTQNGLTPNADADSSPISHFSQLLTQTPAGSMGNFTHTLMPALERDISRALRRMSDISNMSQEASALRQGDGGFQGSTDSSGLLNFMGISNRREPRPLKPLKQGFYHESALHQTWLDSQNIERVRIPIRHNQSVSSTLQESNSMASAAAESVLGEMTAQDLNGTEWETVIDGVTSKFKTAGSSLANNSSAGNISPILFEHNDFSSTDRIIQHPAQVDFSHDYRYREIKEGNFPVLLPSYKPHTVNGFPANSCRSISPFQQSFGDLYQPPPPLPRSHTNPFRSPPPEVITINSRSSETLDRDGFDIESPSRPKFGPLCSTTICDRPDSWMDEFGDPGPAIRPIATMHTHRPSNLSEHTLSESYSSSQMVGSSIADASSSALSAIIHDLGSMQDTRKDGTSKVAYEVERINARPLVTDEDAPFLRRPPGAFYQGVRSGPDFLRKGSSSDRSGVTRISQRKTAQLYPTNKIRPLSLAQGQCIESVRGADEHGNSSGGRLSDSFMYRSPLAPIKSKRWCDLYTREQLSSMHIDAEIERAIDSAQTSSRSFYPAFGDGLKMDNSWKRTWSPHLRPWPRDNSSIKSDLSGRKRKISNIVLCLCCLFPPMLILYGIGYLDNTMLWITNGEISSFNKAHKRVSLQLACFFIIAILIIVPITVAIKVTGSK